MILTADYPPAAWSGIGVTVKQQAHALVSSGIEVEVVVAAGPRSGFRCAQQPQGKDAPKVHYLTGQRFPVDPGRFDLLHLHSLSLSQLAFELRTRFRLPLIYTAHSLLHLELAGRPEAAYWCAVQGRVLALSDRIIFLSNAERSAAVSLLPEISSRAAVLPNGVPGPFNTGVTSNETGERGPIVFAGRFTKSKGIRLLAEMIPLLLEKCRTRFVLAGGHGEPGCIRLIRKLIIRFPGTCRIAGWLSRRQLDMLFKKASLVLIPSLYEPFGLVALEAMRMGAPVLVSAVGGLAEIATPESGGRQVSSRDPREWADSALEILANPDINRKLRQQGPKYVAVRYHVNQIVKRLVREIYLKFISGRSSVIIK
jgi:glycosyltransferase involved in cell wall biosynthesis